MYFVNCLDRLWLAYNWVNSQAGFLIHYGVEDNEM